MIWARRTCWPRRTTGLELARVQSMSETAPPEAATDDWRVEPSKQPWNVSVPLPSSRTALPSPAPMKHRLNWATVLNDAGAWIAC